MNRLSELCLGVFLSVATLLSAGCSSQYGLVMSSTKELVNQGASSPELAAKGYRKVLLIPSSTGQFSDHAELVTRWDTTLLKAGMVPMSSIHAAVMRSAATQIESAAGQESLTQALKAIRDAGTDVVVGITRLEWSAEEKPSRFFILDESTEQTSFQEVEAIEYSSWTGPKHSFNSPVLTFAAKIVDVATTEILGTIQIQAAANWSLPGDYSATLTLEDDQWVATEASFDYSDKIWIPGAKKATEDRILQLIVDTLPASAGEEKGPAAPETQPSSTSSSTPETTGTTANE